MAVYFREGYKYQLAVRWVHTLTRDLGIIESANFGVFGCDAPSDEAPYGRIWAEVHYAWDGASWFPDFNWILEGSLGHDVMCQLIEEGAIPEDMNDAIDAEMQVIVKIAGYKKHSFGRHYLAGFRGWYVRKGTNMNQKHAGYRARPVLCMAKGRKYELPPGALLPVESSP